MSDYYGESTLESWLEYEIGLNVTKEITLLFEPWRSEIEYNIESWLESDDGEGNHLSWRGWGRGYPQLEGEELEDFESKLNQCQKYKKKL